MSKMPKIKRKEFHAAFEAHSPKETDVALNELIREGELEHAGFEEGDDAFRLTPKGFDLAEKTIATDSHQALFILNMAVEEPILFYRIIERIHELRKGMK